MTPYATPTQSNGLNIALPGFVDDPARHLREDAGSIRRHLDMLDAQAYLLLIERAAQLSCFARIKIIHNEDDFVRTTLIEVVHDPASQEEEIVCRALAKNLEETLNAFDMRNQEDFIFAVQETTWLNADNTSSVVAGIYNQFYAKNGRATWGEGKTGLQKEALSNTTPAVHRQKPRASL